MDKKGSHRLEELAQEHWFRSLYVGILEATETYRIAVSYKQG